MMIVDVSEFGQTNLIFDDPGVKINSTYYHDVLLTRQLSALSISETVQDRHSYNEILTVTTEY